MKTKEKTTRKDAREHLARFHLACELVKVIRHCFPGLLTMLKRLEDPRDQHYITYESHVILMTRILSSIFYISSMRKTSEEFTRQYCSYCDEGGNILALYDYDGGRKIMGNRRCLEKVNIKPFFKFVLNIRINK